MKTSSNINFVMWVAVCLAAHLGTSAKAMAAEPDLQHIQSLYAEKQFGAVLEELKQLLADYPNNIDCEHLLGRTLVDMGDYEAAIPHLQSVIDRDTDRNWRYAWTMLYLGSANHALGNRQQAGKAYRSARDLDATRNCTRQAIQFIAIYGYHEIYNDWVELETEHFRFQFAGDLGESFRSHFAEGREEALKNIADFFGGIPEKKVDYFVWSNRDAALDIGLPALGFARPELNLIHSGHRQTRGHEITHIVVSHVLNPKSQCGLVNEGVAVMMDQSGADQMKRARRVLNGSDNVEISIAGLWLDFRSVPSELSYPVAGAWMQWLLDSGGAENLLALCADQSLANARSLYGENLAQLISEFEKDLLK